MAEVAAQNPRIGDFELLAKLGEGGMGAVYKARQISQDRIVALKVLPPKAAADNEFIQRFLREARATAKLNHPNIVRAYAVGSADGYHVFAMELVEGTNLKKRIVQLGKLAEDEVILVGAAVASALAHAHDTGIIHRDVKPENILMDKDGAPKLSDLGLVIVQGDGSLTQTGFAVGTPHYMSPEQSRGDKDIDHRADIYALGCTLYHAATGRTPFDGPTPAVLMVKHINEKIPHPQSINPDLSNEFCMVLERMMTRGKDDRYADCHEAARDLELLVEGEPPECDPLPANKSNFIPLAKTGGASKPRIPNPKMSARIDKRTSNAALTPPRDSKPQWPMLVAIGVSSLLLTVGVVKYFGIGAPAAQPPEPPPKETKKTPEPPPDVKPPEQTMLVQPEPSVAAPKAPPGAVLLFNGVDLTGWREVSPKWFVEKGALVSIGESTSSSLSCAQRLPCDFELTFSIKLKGAFHMTWGYRGSASTEVLMHNSKNYVTLEKYNPMSDGINTPIGNTVKDSSEPRRYRVVQKANKIAVYVDETLVVSSDKGGAAPAGTSRTLMLYAHKESTARFCDIAIRDLGDTAK